MTDRFNKALTRSDLRGERRTGKVRDVYALPGGRTALVATDRLSAFDVVLPTPIPGKGRLLTSIAEFWLRWIESRGLCRTHLISTDAADLPDSAFGPGSTPRERLAGRVTIGRSCRVIPIECVIRGYLEGTGWADYQQCGSVCGVRLPEGLRRADRLPEPIFTPASKAAEGEHDENIDVDRAARIIGVDRLAWLERVSLAIYSEAAAYALDRGIIIADTKFEFGIPIDDPEGEPVLIDEALTPDSSRFWPADRYEPGRAQPSFDKQYVREHLQTLIDRGLWDRRPPGPTLPEDVVAGTLERYRRSAELLTG
ncbi:MAG: phosphoribosylaminoimidazolesuccinocarboxamide synthase [Planctomycetota bacterium]